MGDVISRVENRILSIRPHTEAGRIVLLCDGKYVCDFRWEAGDRIADVLRQACRVAENEAAAASQVMDQAILFRAGAPIGLSGNPKVYDEAIKEAVSNRDLRRSNLKLSEELPMARQQFGIPRVTNGRPGDR